MVNNRVLRVVLSASLGYLENNIRCERNGGFAFVFARAPLLPADAGMRRAGIHKDKVDAERARSRSRAIIYSASSSKIIGPGDGGAAADDDDDDDDNGSSSSSSSDGDNERG